MQESEITIYTDGACQPNPGKGGWAAILIIPSRQIRREIFGHCAYTTNNRMEMTAALEALKRIKHPATVRIVTDSQYLVNGFNKGWVKRWARNAWRKVKNDDLWKELCQYAQRHQIQWEWVRGHENNLENCRADALANAQAGI